MGAAGDALDSAAEQRVGALGDGHAEHHGLARRGAVKRADRGLAVEGGDDVTRGPGRSGMRGGAILGPGAVPATARARR